MENETDQETCSCDLVEAETPNSHAKFHICDLCKSKALAAQIDLPENKPFMEEACDEWEKIGNGGEPYVDPADVIDGVMNDMESRMEDNRD